MSTNRIVDPATRVVFVTGVKHNRRLPAGPHGRLDLSRRNVFLDRIAFMDTPEHASPIKDAKRIDLDDPAEVAAWCTLLKLSEADLRTAVSIIGPMSAAVAVYVNSRGRRTGPRQIGEIGKPFERRAQPRGDEGQPATTRGDSAVDPSIKPRPE